MLGRAPGAEILKSQKSIMLVKQKPLQVSRTCRPLWQCFASRIVSKPVQAASIDLDGLDLDMPDIDGDLRSIQQELGAVFDDKGVARTFGNARQAVAALEAGVILVDRSHWGRLRMSGEGAINFMHNQSTNDFKKLQQGQGCDTVFVTSTARTLDLATAFVMSPTSLMVLVSPSTKESLKDRLSKYIFPGDNVQISDVSDKCCMLTLMGPESSKVLQEVAGEAFALEGKPYGSFQLVKFKTGPLIIVSGSGLATPGYTLIVDEALAGDLYAILASKGCILMGEDEWEIARVLEGRPAPGTELTEDHNPLEAGLAHAVSVDKGCYIGQETLSKVSARNGVKQHLWGLSLQEPVQPGTDVCTTSSEGAAVKVGRVTSVATTPDGRNVALAYLKAKDADGKKQWEGATVQVGSTSAIVVLPPFVTRTLSNQMPEGVSGPGADAAVRQAEADRAAAIAAAQAEAEAKAKKLKEMQERLAAWQAQQAAYTQQQQQQEQK